VFACLKVHDSRKFDNNENGENAEPVVAVDDEQQGNYAKPPLPDVIDLVINCQEIVVHKDNKTCKYRILRVDDLNTRGR